VGLQFRVADYSPLGGLGTHDLADKFPTPSISRSHFSLVFHVTQPQRRQLPEGP
jgi:hypothetical protein